jgi:hypothetical protein
MIKNYWKNKKMNNKKIHKNLNNLIKIIKTKSILKKVDFLLKKKNL